MLGFSLRPSGSLGVNKMAFVHRLIGAGRYQHAQGGNGGLRGRSFAGSHFAQVANVRLPGGNLFRGHVTAGVLG